MEVTEHAELYTINTVISRCVLEASGSYVY